VEQLETPSITRMVVVKDDLREVTVANVPSKVDQLERVKRLVRRRNTQTT
jgi:hypothetical protein